MPGAVGLVGRQAELAVLDRCLAGLAGSGAAIVDLVGDPGMGKTSVLRELALRAAARSVPILAGRAQEQTAGIPFAVLHDALLSCDDPLAQAVSRSADRYETCRRFREELGVRAGTGGLVLALDDVHWADPASAELLAYLLRRPPDGPVLIVLARRYRQAPARFACGLAEAVRDGTVTQVRLGPLPRQDAFALLEALPMPARDTVYSLSEGCPLYLEALRDSVLSGADPAIGGVEPPASGAAALLSELEPLSAETRLVAEAAALVGDPLDVELVARVADRPADAVLGAVDELVRRDLLRCEPDGARIRFRHPLVRSAAYGNSGAGWRKKAHARAVAALRDRGQAPMRCAYHAERALAGVDREIADLLVRAAEEVAASAPATAARWLEAALQAFGGLADDPRRRTNLLFRRASALGVSGQLRASGDAFRELLAASPEQRLRDAVVAGIAALERHLGRHQEAASLLRDELARSGAEKPTALLLELACHHFLCHDEAELARYAGQAHDLARRAGEPLAQATAATLTCLADCARGDIATAGTHLAEAQRLIDAATDRELSLVLETFVGLGMAESALDRHADAILHLRRAVRICRRTGQSYTLSHLLTVLADAYTRGGDLRAAAEAAEQALDAAMMTDSEPARMVALNSLAEQAVDAGEWARAVTYAEQAAALTSSRDDWPSCLARGGLSLARVLTGDPRGRLGDYVAWHGGPDLPVLNAVWRPKAYGTLTHAALRAGDAGAAAEWACRAEAAADRLGLDSATGHALLARAEVAVAADPAAAVEAAKCAVERFHQARLDLFAARAMVTLGRAHEACGEDEPAGRQYDRAELTFDRCGAGALRAAVRTHHRPAMTALLSRRECEVARLIARGHSNRQIARSLQVSDKTVETHVTNILRKLQVQSRAAVAGLVSRDLG